MLGSCTIDVTRVGAAGERVTGTFSAQLVDPEPSAAARGQEALG